MSSINNALLPFLIPTVCRLLQTATFRNLAEWEFLYANVGVMKDGTYSLVIMPANKRDVHYGCRENHYTAFRCDPIYRTAVESITLCTIREGVDFFPWTNADKTSTKGIAWCINARQTLETLSLLEMNINRYSDTTWVHNSLTEVEHTVNVDIHHVVQFSFTSATMLSDYNAAVFPPSDVTDPIVSANGDLAFFNKVAPVSEIADVHRFIESLEGNLAQHATKLVNTWVSMNTRLIVDGVTPEVIIAEINTHLESMRVNSENQQWVLVLLDKISQIGLPHQFLIHRKSSDIAFDSITAHFELENWKRINRNVVIRFDVAEVTQSEIIESIKTTEDSFKGFNTHITTGGGRSVLQRYEELTQILSNTTDKLSKQTHCDMFATWFNDLLYSRVRYPNYDFQKEIMFLALSNCGRLVLLPAHVDKRYNSIKLEYQSDTQPINVYLDIRSESPIAEVSPNTDGTTGGTNYNAFVDYHIFNLPNYSETHAVHLIDSVIELSMHNTNTTSYSSAVTAINVVLSQMIQSSGDHTWIVNLLGNIEKRAWPFTISIFGTETKHHFSDSLVTARFTPHHELIITLT